MGQDCVQLNALHILKFLSKNIDKFLFGKRKLTKRRLMTLFTLRLGGYSGRIGTIFCQVCRFQSNLVKLRQNGPLTRFESFLTVLKGLGKHSHFSEWFNFFLLTLYMYDMGVRVFLCLYVVYESIDIC